MVIIEWKRGLRTILAALIAFFVTGESVHAAALDDLPVNRWIPIEVTCEGGDPNYNGGCPTGRGWTQLTYDLTRDRVVMFGGSGEWYFNDLWYFDPVNRVWSLVLQDTRLAGVKKDWSQYPRGRDNHEFVYDPKHDVYWMYGGTGKGGMWKFDPNVRNWVPLWPEHGMGPLEMASMDPGFALSPDTDHILLFGGTRYSPRDATWLFNTNSQQWRELHPPQAPQARAQIENAMTYDNFRHQFILFGGQAKGRTRQSLGDTWIFDPSAGVWRDMRPNHAPPARDRHVLVFDQKNGVAIMLGGYKSADTWIYDPKDNRWRELKSARGGYDPTNAYVSSAVYIPKYDVTLFRDKKGKMYYLRLNLQKLKAYSNEALEH